MELIERGINMYHSRTCIRWVPRTHEKDYVAFTNDNSGCWSSVGKIGGRQVSCNLMILCTQICYQLDH